MPKKLFILSIIYGVTCLAGVWSFCGVDIFKCTVANQISMQEAFIPATFLALILFGIGIIVSGLIYWVHNWLMKTHGNYAWIFLIPTGAVIGAIPRAAWTLATGVYPNNYYPNAEYLLFLLAGAVVAVMCLVVFRKRPDTSD